MLIHCTKKLLDELEVKPILDAEERPLYSWHANLIMVNRRKTVVLCNDKNRYVIVLHGLKTKDFKNLKGLIIQAIRETLLDESIKAEIVEEFIKCSPEVIFVKASDRPLVAKMNKACDNVQFYIENLIKGTVIQTGISMKASNYFFQDKDGKDSYSYPNEVMYKDLEPFSNGCIFSCKVVKMKITLELEDYEVWRRVIVPYNITFTELHDIMQTLFHWQDYHLHEFYIMDGEKQIVNLVYDDESLEYADERIESILEDGIKLSEYVPKYKRMQYNYDFGDDWTHYIEVEEIIDDYPQKYPICLEWHGNAPPEDVGGESGFDEFLNAISDPKHPEYKDMMDWGNMQKYRDFDIEETNRRLKFYKKYR